MPRLDHEKWKTAVSSLDKSLVKQLQMLRKSEKAHIMRVYQAIEQDRELDPQTREKLLTLALLHDIGKSITRHTVFFKIAKVLFPIANTRHCIEGARFLRSAGVSSEVVKRVLRHHSLPKGDLILKKFQEFDDRL